MGRGRDRQCPPSGDDPDALFGAANCDVVGLNCGNLRDGRLIYRRQKTIRSPEGIEINIPVHSYLAQTVALVAGDGFTFLQTARGRSRPMKGLGSSMRKGCDKAGLPLCSSHALRKAICRRVAEAGGTAHAIMSVSGHISLKDAQRYCEAFGRKEMATHAMACLPHGAEQEPNLANHPERFANTAAKDMK